jgi:hypothetical protein
MKAIGLLVWVGIGLTSARVWAASAPTNAHAPALTAEFSPSGGAYANDVKVELSAKRGTLRYTLDGTEPTTQSPAYAKPITLTATTVIKTRLWDSGQPLGPVLSQTFVLVSKDLAKFTSNLPLVIINTFGRGIDKENKAPSSVRFIDVSGGQSSLLGPANFDGRGLVNYRGNSSLRYVKRSYAFKTRDDNGKSHDIPILGFPADNDWILYAPYPDKTLLRDVLAYDLFHQMGHYSSRTKFVEVFVNESGGKLTKRDYKGVFVLEEKIKRGKDRVNIQKLGTNDNTTPNITGGYIFKKDHETMMGQVMPTEDGWPNMMGGNSSSRPGYPTGPGGFPADPKGFLSARGTSGSNRVGRNPPRPVQVEEQFRRLPERNNLGQPGAPGVTFDGPPPAPRRPQEAQPQIEQAPMRVWTPANNPPQEAPFLSRLIQSFTRPSMPGMSTAQEVFFTSRGSQFYYVEPKPEEITPAQKAWLGNHLNQFEKVLYGPDFKDPDEGYAAYIDVDSFIDQHFLVEVTKNIDGFRFSTFFHKDRGGKIKMEPVWDWNLSFGNANGKQGWLPEYWYWPQLDDQQYSWYRRLFDDPDFGQRYVDRWGQLRTNVFAVSNMQARIDAMVAQLGEATARNFERWPILGKKVWPNYYVGRTYEDEINWMKDWIARRVNWIDRQFVAAPTLSRRGGKSGDNAVLSAPAGTIYYALDGTDPRLSGGAVSSKARVYDGTIALPQNAHLIARVQFENRWSPPAKL